MLRLGSEAIVVNSSTRELAIEVAGVPDHDPANCEACIEADVRDGDRVARRKLHNQLKRNQPIKRTAWRRKPSKAKRAYDRAFAMSTLLVRARSGGRCEYIHVKSPDDNGFRRCTWNVSGPPHHRKRRSQGGSNSRDNLLDLCPYHHDLVHANPLVSVARGYLIPSHEPEVPFG